MAGAFLVRLAVDPILGARQPFPTFYVAVALTAWFGGRVGAVCVLVLGFLLAEWFFVARGETDVLRTPTAADLVGSTLYFTVGAVIIGAVEAWRRAHHRTRDLLTQLRRREQRLQRALADVETVTTRMAAAVTRCSRDLRYVWVSERYAQWIGSSRDAVVGRSIVEVVGPAAFDRLRPYFDRVLAGERVAYEEEIEFRGIGRRWVSAVYEPTHDAAGAIDGWVAVVSDITQRKGLELAVDRARTDAEARLRETTALMAASRELSRALLLEDLLDTVCHIARELFGADGATFVVREGAQVRYAAESAIGPLWKGQRFPIEHCISGWAVLERATAVVPDIASDARIPLDAYRPTFVRSLVMAPVRRADPIGAIGVYWATGREASGDEVRLLEALADIASIAVQNARLFAEVTSANQAKDEFLAMLAHELRNPLAPIRNAVAVLRMIGTNEGTAIRARDLIDRQVTHMARLVDDLLDVSRITRGRIALRKEILPLHAIVEEAIEAARPLLDEHRHTLAVSLPDGVIEVDADRARVVQVLANLLANAAKFTPDEGHVTLTVERTSADEAVVRVRDTGIGVPPELQTRIFDLFVQEEHGVARARGGLGIGLTLVKRLVELHGGRVAVTSDGRDRGAQFTIVLPALSKTATTGRVAAPSSEDVTGGSLRIMVVEDNPDSAESFGMLLRLSGHDVRVLPRGVDALRLLDNFVADIAFLDIGLPGMDGFELARRLRNDPRVDGMVLVALTGYGSDADRDQTRRAGFDHHLTKPIDVDALQALLGTVATAQESPRVVH